MSTLEKLFVQIFERKERLIEQIQQQADSYTQQLASTLLIDGITPPSWLLYPNSSNSNDLEKEDIISKLLLRPTRDSVAYSRGNCSLYSQLVVAGNDGRLLKEMCVETNSPNKGLHVSDELMKTLDCENNETFECPDKDERCSLSCAAEKDDGIISPLNETDARISSIYSAPDMSLVRIQRSKSRQKARELRNSGKAPVKSCLGNDNRTAISFSGDLKSDFRHVSQDKRQSEADKCNDMSGSTSIAAEGKVEKGNDRTSHSSRLAKSSSPNESPSYVNDPSKNSSSFEKDELDGSNQVQPIGNILQQPGHSDVFMKEGKHPEVCLGSNASRKSMVEKTRDTQRHNKAFWGRITRSRSSIQQTCGIDESSNLGTSDTCIPKECGGALPQFASNLMDGLNASNKLSDAVETSQVLSDRIGETQAISSNEGVLKQVNSSNVVGARVTRSRSGPMNKSQLAANHQESANVLVGNGPREAPVVMQPVRSGIKLDAVTLCTESEGLASRESPGCSMGVKPKQLNFDEIDECDLNEVCSPLSKKRRLGGLSRDECYPSKESASSVDYKASGNFFEQQLPETNVLSNSPIAAMTHFYNNIECAKDETLNISLDKNEKPMVEAVEHISKLSVHDNIDVTCEIDTSPKEVHNILDEEKHSEKCHLSEDHASLPDMQIEEGDLGHKGEQSVAGDANSSFVSNLTKQGNKDSEDCLDNEVRIPEKDLGSSKSKEFDVGKNLKLSNVKLNSAKFNTSPENQQRNIEDQPNCFSDSQGCRVHIQRDAIHCDMEATENDLDSVKESASVLPSEEMNVSLSDDIPSCDRRVCDDMMCDLPEGTESLHKLQAAEASATEVGDVTTETNYTPKHSEPTCISNLIRNVAEDSTYSLVADMEPPILSSIDDVITDNKNSEKSFSEWVSSFASFQSLQTDDKSVIVSDEIMPIYEGFIIDEEVENACMENAEGRIDFHSLEIPSTTIARASIIEKICKSATMETPLSQFSSKLMQPQVQDMYGFMADGTLEQMDLGSIVSLDEDSKKHLQTSDSDINEICRASQNQQQFDSVPLAASPYYWQSKSHYLSPVGKFWERSGSSSGSSEKQFSSNPELTCFPIEEDPRSDEESEQRENHDEMAVEKEPPPEATEVCSQHANPVSMSKKYPDRCSSNSVNIELSVPRTRDNVKYKPKNHPGIKISRYGEDNRTSSIATRASSRGNVSEYSKAKSSLRSGIPRVSQKEAKRNNIVSNITSFIPIVQQKQAAAVCTGKRDIKVKALEAAEAAKRREQEKENERKIKKEALKLERARIGKENAREMELDKKKKQDALKKKEADIAARKRQREEEEKKQVAKKRKLVAEAQKNQKLQYEKSRFGKVELEKQQSKNSAIAGNKKGSENLRQTTNADENSSQRHNAELKTDKALVSVIQQVASVPEKRDDSFGCGEKEKATSALENTPVKVEPVKSTNQENSYVISPYQCSDDEDDEENDLPTKKFVPSWASKSRVAMVLPLQQSLNPETIFPVKSFCSMDEVLLPRRVKQVQ